MNLVKRADEKEKSENQVTNDRSVKPTKNFDAKDLIGAQIKISYQNKMDGDSFLIT